MYLELYRTFHFAVDLCACVYPQPLCCTLLPQGCTSPIWAPILLYEISGFFLSLWSQPTDKMIFIHLICVDQLNFPLTQSEESFANSGKILQWLHIARGVGLVGKKSIYALEFFGLFVARCWGIYWKNTITGKYEQPKVILKKYGILPRQGDSFPVLISNAFGADGRYHLGCETAMLLYPIQAK